MGGWATALQQICFEEIVLQSIDEPSETNWQRWEKNKVSARQKRILTTWIFGEAWADIQKPQYRALRLAAFAHSGCGITESGVNDHLVIGEGLLEPFDLAPAGTEFVDDDYTRDVWSGHPDFGKKPVIDVPIVDAGVADAMDDWSDLDPMGLDSSDDEMEIAGAMAAALDLPDDIALADIPGAIIAAEGADILPVCPIQKRGCTLRPGWGSPPPYLANPLF